MSGKPAARQGDATQCPKKGHGSNAIISGSPDVLFNGMPAARLGDKTACGSVITGQVIPNVLINGRPAVVTGSTGSHGDVVMGGSGDIFIGGAVTFATGEPLSSELLNASQALAPTGEPTQHLRQNHQHAELPETLEYEEEEEETELPLEQRITLRLGLFFDGTGNNLANAALTEQCRRQDLSDFDPATLQAVAQLCESRQYRDTNGDGLFDQMPGSSYGNAMTNVALLSRLYEDHAGEVLSASAISASLPVYIDGIGTSSGGPDSLRGMATGQGDTGVVSRVAQTPEAILRQLDRLMSNNPLLVIERVEFDIFGFSRGAAAARHFANEVLKPAGGLLATNLNKSSPAFTTDFDWSEHACINFIGLFDTVAAIIDPTRSDLSAGNARNPGINLYLPPDCARKVVQLTAQHEERYLFSLNQVDPAHEEIALPGVHSDIGGGYPPLMHERLLVDRPRVIPYQRGDNNLSPNAIRATRQWDERNTAQMRLMGLGLPGDGEFKREQTSQATPNQRNLDATDTVLVLGLDRKVRAELSRVALRVMHMLARQHAVTFQPIDESDDRMSIPAELRPISDKIISHAQRGLSAPLTAEESRFLHGYYIHRSANWTTFRGLLINRPRSGGRAIYPDQPQKGYPE
ncbi:PAAR domain-containing protein [Halopseudomonas pelagia]|uniref:PAAR domain-containing protein n=1 Tax=Halopseudomonas pelagia TaxID=553151 RepID=UPI0030DD5436|tara:strand:+ start:125186 stop:127087 length:1902 start_codon:yes stop_codon:yes gene_type:complete